MTLNNSFAEEYRQAKLCMYLNWRGWSFSSINPKMITHAASNIFQPFSIVVPIDTFPAKVLVPVTLSVPAVFISIPIVVAADTVPTNVRAPNVIVKKRTERTLLLLRVA